MKIELSPKPYSGKADQPGMIALAQADPGSNLHLVDLPYRLSSWALDEAANAALWVDADGELCAWAVMQTPFWAIDCAFAPAAEAQGCQTVLAWAQARAQEAMDTTYGHPCWFVNVFSDQAERRLALEAAGFADQGNVGEDAWSKVLLQRPGDLPVKATQPPAGFELRTLGGEGEVQAYVSIHRAAFESKSMTAAWRLHTLRRPEYRPELDLVMAAPGGRLGAFCIGWMSKLGNETIGQIEPLGVHPDFQGLGLGRAILAEALQRMSSLGAGQVWVETDSYRDAAFALYESAGFRIARDVLVYHKDFEKG
jgi:mycothiol synthase